MVQDDDEEFETIGVGTYPVMPSLVALQQMRNRLHLAMLGRKLMKWSALATGRELRKIAAVIDETYKNFGQEIADAFMTLARARYYYANLQNIVLQGCNPKAAITVIIRHKIVSAGVRIIEYEIHEDHEHPPYHHLGIQKGGETIKLAKRLWNELLKRLVLICQLRNSFDAVDIANKSATKRKNVLQKIVIPKTFATIRYILLELEEADREEKFRIKKVVQYKKKKQLKKPEEESIRRSSYALRRPTPPAILQEYREQIPEKLEEEHREATEPLVQFVDTRELQSLQKFIDVEEPLKVQEPLKVEEPLKTPEPSPPLPETQPCMPCGISPQPQPCQPCGISPSTIRPCASRGAIQVPSTVPCEPCGGEIQQPPAQPCEPCGIIQQPLPEPCEPCGGVIQQPLPEPCEPCGGVMQQPLLEPCKPCGSAIQEPSAQPCEPCGIMQPSAQPCEPCGVIKQPSAEPCKPCISVIQQPLAEPCEPSPIIQEPLAKPCEPSAIIQEPLAKPSEPSTIIQEPLAKPCETSAGIQQPSTQPYVPYSVTQQPSTQPYGPCGMMQQPIVQAYAPCGLMQPPQIQVCVTCGVGLQPLIKSCNFISQTPAQPCVTCGAMQQPQIPPCSPYGIIPQPTIQCCVTCGVVLPSPTQLCVSCSMIQPYEQLQPNALSRLVSQPPLSPTQQSKPCKEERPTQPSEPCKEVQLTQPSEANKEVTQETTQDTPCEPDKSSSGTKTVQVNPGTQLLLPACSSMKITGSAPCLNTKDYTKSATDEVNGNMKPEINGQKLRTCVSSCDRNPKAILCPYLGQKKSDSGYPCFGSYTTTESNAAPNYAQSTSKKTGGYKDPSCKNPKCTNCDLNKEIHPEWYVKYSSKGNDSYKITELCKLYVLKAKLTEIDKSDKLCLEQPSTLKEPPKNVDERLQEETPESKYIIYDFEKPKSSMDLYTSIDKEMAIELSESESNLQFCHKQTDSVKETCNRKGQWLLPNKTCSIRIKCDSKENQSECNAVDDKCKDIGKKSSEHNKVFIFKESNSIQPCEYLGQCLELDKPQIKYNEKSSKSNETAKKPSESEPSVPLCHTQAYSITQTCKNVGQWLQAHKLYAICITCDPKRRSRSENYLHNDNNNINEPPEFECMNKEEIDSPETCENAGYWLQTHKLYPIQIKSDHRGNTRSNKGSVNESSDMNNSSCLKLGVYGNSWATPVVSAILPGQQASNNSLCQQPAPAIKPNGPQRVTLVTVEPSGDASTNEFKGPSLCWIPSNESQSNQSTCFTRKHQSSLNPCKMEDIDRESKKSVPCTTKLSKPSKVPTSPNGSSVSWLFDKCSKESDIEAKKVNCTHICESFRLPYKVESGEPFLENPSYVANKNETLTPVSAASTIIPEKVSVTKKVKTKRSHDSLGAQDLETISKTVRVRRVLKADGTVDVSKKIIVKSQRRADPGEKETSERSSCISNSSSAKSTCNHYGPKDGTSVCFLSLKQACNSLKPSKEKKKTAPFNKNSELFYEIEDKSRYEKHFKKDSMCGSAQTSAPILRNCISDISPATNKPLYILEVSEENSSESYKSEPFMLAKIFQGIKDVPKHTNNRSRTSCKTSSDLQSLTSIEILNNNFKCYGPLNKIVLRPVEPNYAKLRILFENGIHSSSCTTKSIATECSDFHMHSDCSSNYLKRLEEERRTLIKVVQDCVNELLEDSTCNQSDQNQCNSKAVLNGRETCKKCLFELSGICTDERSEFNENCKICQKKAETRNEGLNDLISMDSSETLSNSQVGMKNLQSLDKCTKAKFRRMTCKACYSKAKTPETCNAKKTKKPQNKERSQKRSFKKFCHSIFQTHPCRIICKNPFMKTKEPIPIKTQNMKSSETIFEKSSQTLNKVSSTWIFDKCFRVSTNGIDYYKKSVIGASCLSENLSWQAHVNDSRAGPSCSHYPNESLECLSNGSFESYTINKSFCEKNAHLRRHDESKQRKKCVGGTSNNTKSRCFQSQSKGSVLKKNTLRNLKAFPVNVFNVIQYKINSYKDSTVQPCTIIKSHCEGVGEWLEPNRIRSECIICGPNNKVSEPDSQGIIKQGSKQSCEKVISEHTKFYENTEISEKLTQSKENVYKSGAYCRKQIHAFEPVCKSAGAWLEPDKTHLECLVCDTKNKKNLQNKLEEDSFTFLENTWETQHIENNNQCCQGISTVPMKCYFKPAIPGTLNNLVRESESISGKSEKPLCHERYDKFKVVCDNAGVWLESNKTHIECLVCDSKSNNKTEGKFEELFQGCKNIPDSKTEGNIRFSEEASSDSPKCSFKTRISETLSNVVGINQSGSDRPICYEQNNTFKLLFNKAGEWLESQKTRLECIVCDYKNENFAECSQSFAVSKDKPEDFNRSCCDLTKYPESISNFIKENKKNDEFFCHGKYDLVCDKAQECLESDKIRLKCKSAAKYTSNNIGSSINLNVENQEDSYQLTKCSYETNIPETLPNIMKINDSQSVKSDEPQCHEKNKQYRVVCDKAGEWLESDKVRLECIVCDPKNKINTEHKSEKQFIASKTVSEILKNKYTIENQEKTSSDSTKCSYRTIIPQNICKFIKINESITSVSEKPLCHDKDRKKKIVCDKAGEWLEPDKTRLECIVCDKNKKNIMKSKLFSNKLKNQDEEEMTAHSIQCYNSSYKTTIADSQMCKFDKICHAKNKRFKIVCGKDVEWPELDKSRLKCIICGTDINNISKCISEKLSDNLKGQDKKNSSFYTTKDSYKTTIPEIVSKFIKERESLTANTNKPLCYQKNNRYGLVCDKSGEWLESDKTRVECIVCDTKKKSQFENWKDKYHDEKLSEFSNQTTVPESLSKFCHDKNKTNKLECPNVAEWLTSDKIRVECIECDSVNKDSRKCNSDKLFEVPKNTISEPANNCQNGLKTPEYPYRRLPESIVCISEIKGSPQSHKYTNSLPQDININDCKKHRNELSSESATYCKKTKMLTTHSNVIKGKKNMNSEACGSQCLDKNVTLNQSCNNVAGWLETDKTRTECLACDRKKSPYFAKEKVTDLRNSMECLYNSCSKGKICLHQPQTKNIKDETTENKLIEEKASPKTEPLEKIEKMIKIKKIRESDGTVNEQRKVITKTTKRPSGKPCPICDKRSLNDVDQSETGESEFGTQTVTKVLIRKSQKHDKHDKHAEISPNKSSEVDETQESETLRNKILTQILELLRMDTGTNENKQEKTSLTANEPKTQVQQNEKCKESIKIELPSQNQNEINPCASSNMYRKATEIYKNLCNNQKQLGEFISNQIPNCCKKVKSCINGNVTFSQLIKEPLRNYQSATNMVLNVCKTCHLELCGLLKKPRTAQDLSPNCKLCLYMSNNPKLSDRLEEHTEDNSEPCEPQTILETGEINDMPLHIKKEIALATSLTQKVEKELKIDSLQSLNTYRTEFDHVNHENGSVSTSKARSKEKNWCGKVTYSLEDPSMKSSRGSFISCCSSKSKE